MSTLYIRDKDGKFIQLPSIPGKSSYEIAVEKGVFSGTEEEFAQQQVFGNKEILDSITQDQIDFWNSAKGMTEEEKIALSKKFDDVELNEAETNETQTALDFFANGVKIKTVYFSGGGGGSTDAPPYISTIISENNILGVGDTFNLQLDFSSSVIGRGTLKVFINDKETISMSIPQGESNIPLEDKYFDKGNNRVTMYAIDRTGVMSNSLTFYVRYGSLEIATDFDPYTAYDYGAVIRYYFTPTAVDTSLTLTMYMSIDGEVKPGVMCTSDTRGYYTFPNNLNVGAHHCQAYIIDSAGNTSNILSFNLIIIDDTSLIVASDTINPSLEEGSQLSLDYKVYMKNNTSFITKTYVDNALVNTGTCGLEMSYYRTSSLSEGVHTIRLEVYDVTETVSDYILWTVTITPSTYTMLEPVTAGALFIGTAQNMSNSSENKEVWIGKDQDGNTISAQLNGFAFNSESGWVNDELLITGASSVEVPITPLANNARYGFTLDIEFASKMIGVEDALVLNLWDDEKDCGIKITTEKVIIRSAEGNQSDLYFTDDEMTSVIFVIDRNETTAKIYLNGVMCSAFHLSDYNVDGVPYLEDFTVDGPIILGGSGHARIKNLRVYQIALTTDEILNNFMANEKDKGKQRELVEFQKGEHLPTLTIYCDFSGLGKDDKKPCSITYISTDEEKYGKSFTLSHKKSSLQYQGTSSMAYPIKNYRINLADENGNKLRYEFPFGKPEYRYTLKADFMSSGHWTNTGLTKWINENLYNYNADDEKSMNPKKWHDINNGGDLDDTRECIYGFPCRLILVNDGNTPLNEGQNEPTPGNTKDMGIFNFNHDKDATDTMGFDQDAFPNCASYEVTANSDTSAGAFMPKMIDTIEIDSAGSYVTGLIYTNEIKSNILKVESDGYIGNLCTYWDSSDTMNYINLRTSTLDLVANDVAYFKLYFDGDKTQPTYIKINDMEFKTVLVETGPKNVTSFYQKDEAELLDYIKQSFEMRFPDEEDVPEGWGYMGIEEAIPVNMIDYWTQDNVKYTTIIEKPENVTIETPSNYLFFFSYYNNGEWVNDSGNFSGTNPIDLSGRVETHIAIGLRGGLPEEYIIINGEKYLFANEVVKDTFKNPYPSETVFETVFNNSLGLKALIDWVDGCTDEEFVRDFEQHFHKDYTFRYYLLVITLGMVDNLGKNMMLDTWDNKIFMPRFYDCDTICSYDNSGQLKFDVDIEMEQGYWNTSTSRLWTRIRDLFHDELVAKYNNMRQNGLSYESLMRCFYDEQIAKIPQKYYNMDYDVKYAPFADSYLGMANGDTYEHLKRWLKNRLIFVDTLYDYAPSYNNDMLTIRANTTEPMTLYIETYTPVYQHLSWYNGQMDKKKIDGKIAVEFTGTAMAETDQEVLIYGGSNIKAIRGISSMNPNRMLIGSATRLIELDASDCPLLSDINANKSNLAPHVYLNRVDLSGCPLLGGNLIINNSPLIREIDIRGTGIGGLNLPASIRNLEILRLPNTISSISLNDASQLHTLEFEEGVNVKTVSMTNCNSLTNVTNFNLQSATNVTLNNSYNTEEELYFSATTNLSLSNMSNLERVIFTPNAEYEVFDRNNVNNAPDYKVNVFNAPKCNTFMVTAPYRKSYMLGSSYEMEPTGESRTILDCVKSDGTQYIVTDYYPNANTKIVADLQMTPETVYDYWIGTDTFKVQFGNALGTSIANTGVTISPSSNYTSRNVWTISATSNVSSLIPLHIFAGYYNGALESKYLGIGMIYSFKIYEGETLLHDYEPCLDTNGVACMFDKISKKFLYAQLPLIAGNEVEVVEGGYEAVIRRDHGELKPNEVFMANSIDISNTKFTDVKLLCTTDTNKLNLPKTVKNFIADSAYDIDTDFIEDASYETIHNELLPQYAEDYNEEVKLIRQQTKVLTNNDLNRVEAGVSTLYYAPDIEIVSDGKIMFSIDSVNSSILLQGIADNGTTVLETYITHGSTVQPGQLLSWQPVAGVRYLRLRGMKSLQCEYTITYGAYAIPNIVPSASDGSIIYSINSDQEGVWNLDGLELDNFFTYGMNNDVKPTYGYVEKGKELHATELTWESIPTWSGVYRTYIDLPSNATAIVSKSATLLQVTCFDKDGVTLSTVNNTPSGTPYILPENTRSLYLSEYAAYTTDPSIWYELIYNETEIAGVTMPQRCSDYNVTMKNANISPKELPTMLYPLLVDETNPVEGTLDYTNYVGKSLDYAFAYTKASQVDRILPLEVYTNSESSYYMTYDSDMVIRHPNVIAEYTATTTTAIPSIKPDTFQYDYEIEPIGDNYKYTIRTKDPSILPERISFSDATVRNMFLTVDYLNTSNINTMESMFYFCGKLTTVNVTGWDTSKVTSMGTMFQTAESLTSIIGIEDLDTSNVTNMTSMFYNAKALQSLNLSKWNTGKVRRMEFMFGLCNELTSIDVSGFNTSNVTSMTNMFNGCTKLVTLDLSSFDTSQVTDMQDMFTGCESLVKIKGDFILNNVDADQMFNNCLKGPDISELTLSGTCISPNRMFGSFGFGNTPLVSSIDLSNITLVNCGINSYMFFRCTVVDIYPPNNITVECDLGNTDLSREVLLRFLNNLAVVSTSPICTLGTTNMNKLTEEDIAIAVNKGWTIA